MFWMSMNEHEDNHSTKYRKEKWALLFHGNFSDYDWMI